MRTQSTLLPLALAGAVALTGCGDISGPAQGFRSIQLDERLVHAYTGFGLDLFGRLARETPDSNVFISPTSAAFALAMTYNGAAGETREAMARTLGIGGMTLEEANRANQQWLGALANTGDRKVELSLANSLWIRQGYPTVPDFLDRNRTFYSAEVQELDFGHPSAPKTINDWVSRSTRGKIDKIVESIPGNVVAYLINALYFKGDWTHQFDEGQTRSAPFFLPDGTQKTVPMMSQRREFSVLHTPSFQAVELPYGNGRFSMVLALPNEDSSLQAFYQGLTAERWAEWRSAFQPMEVVVALPRFSIEWEKSLKEVLGAMGMEIAFDGGRADFRAMSPSNPFISDVVQKTILEVNEEGTVAAAVTKVAMAESAPPELRFDRPFFLAIQDNATGTLLFMGQITDPS